MATCAAVTRITKELQDVSEGRWKEKQIAVELIDPKNPLHLRSIIISPPGGPTSGYIFTFNIQLDRDHPFKPPIITAVQDIWHPKFKFGHSPSNGICLFALTNEGWQPKYTLETLLISIQQMLVDPGDMANGGGVINGEAYEQYLSNKNAYNKTARECAKEDNAGFGMVQFEDHRLTAIKSILKGICGKFDHMYEVMVMCQKETSHLYRLVVFITPTFEIYHQNVKFKYASSYRKITSFEFQFECDVAVVDIGNSLSIDKCWKITAGIESTVCKKDVVEMDPRKDIPPHCTMTVEWLRPERQPDRLIHDMAIRDLESQKKIRSFQVCIDPKSFNTEPLDCRPTLPKLLRGIPTKNSFSYIHIHKEIGDNFFDFGVHLLEDTTGRKVRNIQSEMKGSPVDINREILMQWLDGRGKPVVWKTIVDVLKEIELNELAMAVEEYYMQ